MFLRGSVGFTYVKTQHTPNPEAQLLSAFPPLLAHWELVRHVPLNESMLEMSCLKIFEQKFSLPQYRLLRMSID